MAVNEPGKRYGSIPGVEIGAHDINKFESSIYLLK